MTGSYEIKCSLEMWFCIVWMDPLNKGLIPLQNRTLPLAPSSKFRWAGRHHGIPVVLCICVHVQNSSTRQWKECFLESIHYWVCWSSDLLMQCIPCIQEMLVYCFCAKHSPSEDASRKYWPAKYLWSWFICACASLTAETCSVFIPNLCSPCTCFHISTCG